MAGRSIFFRAAFLVVLAGCSSGSGVVDVAAEGSAVLAADGALIAAEQERDAERALSFYTADAVVQAPDRPSIAGAEALHAFYEEWFAVPYSEMAGDAADVILASSGDMAYVVGASHLSFDAHGIERRLEGKYLSVWRKVDGRWLCAAVSWSGNQPEK